MYKRILVPTDGSEITAKAVQSAISLAKLTGAALTTICAKEPFPYSAISEMQPVPPQEFYDAQERIAAGRVKAVTDAAAALAQSE
ncbi:MAG: universal stress protein [Steroidobacteraceae bacterium]|nr:universal stress protein [Steroidobacteraceae bacterium]